MLVHGLPYADEPPVQMLASGERKLSGPTPESRNLSSFLLSLLKAQVAPSTRLVEFSE